MEKQQASTQKAITNVGPVPWEYIIIGPMTQAAGTVMAVDARDALSRTLTTNNPEGVMYGVALSISADILYDAPGNAVEEYEAVIPGGLLKVRKMGTAQRLDTMVDELRQEHRLKQNVDYAYTLKYGCLNFMCSSVYEEVLRQVSAKHSLQVLSMFTYD